MTDLKQDVNDPSLIGLFHAISFQIAGTAIAFMANSVNYAFLLFAKTSGHEIALSIPIIATALFTIVWGDACLKSQLANIKDASAETAKTYAHADISSQPSRFLRLMNFSLAIILASSQFSILFS
ncbi:hypothetical protein GN286_15280 [Rhodobacteraceae bacterium IMCC15231]|nr:hypothetical protein [Rhodobacteraceae bacterium IMCC15231]